jgi:hypothetical protein
MLDMHGAMAWIPHFYQLIYSFVITKYSIDSPWSEFLRCRILVHLRVGDVTNWGAGGGFTPGKASSIGNDWSTDAIAFSAATQY